MERTDSPRNDISPTFMIHNAKVGEPLPLPDSWGPHQRFYVVVTDVKEQGALAGLMVEGGGSAPLLMAADMQFFIPTVEQALRHDYNVAYAAVEPAHFLRCSYYWSRRSGYKYYLFWFRKAPPLDASTLTAPMRPHPLQRVGPAQKNCPATLEAAEKLIHVLTDDAINEAYEKYFDRGGPQNLAPAMQRMYRSTLINEVQ